MSKSEFAVESEFKRYERTGHPEDARCLCSRVRKTQGNAA